MTLHITHPEHGHGWYVEDDQDEWLMSGPYMSETDAADALRRMSDGETAVRFVQIGWWLPYESALPAPEEERFVSLRTATTDGLREPYKSELVPVYVNQGDGAK